MTTLLVLFLLVLAVAYLKKLRDYRHSDEWMEKRLFELKKKIDEEDNGVSK